MEGEKKTKLKKMKITSVDMVHRGANQDAHINLYKSERASPEAVDAPEAPNPDEIPQGLWKSVVDVVKRFLGTGDTEFKTENEPEPDEIEKAAESFDSMMSVREIQDNRWKYQDALNCSVESILKDDDLDHEEKSARLDETINQFAEAYKELCAKMLNASQNINKATNNPETADDVSNSNTPEGDRDMKIDKSRFSPEELDQYEALIAKGLVEDDEVEKEEEPKVNPAKAKEELEDEEKPVEKGLHPEVAKALAEVEEMKKSMMMDQMKSIAKKYAPLGKKEDELANVLYNMKKSGDASYNEYIAVLDQGLALVEKSGMYEEIGKSGRGYAGGGATVDKIETIASEIQNSDASLTRPQAIMKAWDQHPELIAEYDKEYKGGK